MDDSDAPGFGYDDAAATFGDRLALCRERQDLSQAQLARRLGLRVATIQNWETDRSEPRANKLQMLAGFLNVSMSWLLTGQGEGGPPDMPGGGVSSELTQCLDELRVIRTAQQGLTERLARVEKRLRGIASSEEV